MRRFFDSRHGNLGNVLTLLGVICLLIASIGLNFKQQHDLSAVKDILAMRCEERQASDDAVREDVNARLHLYDALIAVERGNRFIDHTLRVKRIAAYETAAIKARQRLAAVPDRVDCQRVFAVDLGRRDALR